MKAADLVLLTSQIFLGNHNQADISGAHTSPQLGAFKTCPVDTPLSCSSEALPPSLDRCCLNAPGGQFAQTQFWNTNKFRGPPGYLGPENSWTIHGLWPDHCDGKFDSVCDCSRSGDCSSRIYKCKNITCNKEYSNITQILERFDEHDLLTYMSRYWKGNQGDESLHQHEWSKHGTCINTLQPACYNDYTSSQEVVDYFRVAVEVFKGLPTYQWLSDAGIVPSKEQSYSRVNILSALKTPRGVEAVIGCQGTELREVWYFFAVRGSLQSGQFVPSNPDFSGTGGHAGASCPPENIRYLPKDV